MFGRPRVEPIDDWRGPVPPLCVEDVYTQQVNVSMRCQCGKVIAYNGYACVRGSLAILPEWFYCRCGRAYDRYVLSGENDGDDDRGGGYIDDPHNPQLPSGGEQIDFQQYITGRGKYHGRSVMETSITDYEQAYKVAETMATKIGRHVTLMQQDGYYCFM